MELLLAVSLGLEIVGVCVMLAAYYVWTHRNRRW